jgi:uncharacterized RmlC-like cupin family protein
MSQFCEAEVTLLGGAEKRAHIRVGLESGISSISGTTGMSETQDLEREIQRLSEIIGVSESALRAKAMSASDRAWLTKQLASFY